MILLMIGDVVGRPGRKAVAELLPRLRQEHELDLVIANGENAAGGIGITPATAEELFQSGVDVITSGNHIWHHKEIIPLLESEPRILRPLNMPPGVPGNGYIITECAMVVNLLGRVFMGHFECPFRAMDQLLEEVSDKPPVILVDFHGEATAEKMALGWYLDGRVSAVLGTHTHVGTVDTRVLPRGTAYVSDVGMVGAADSVIGDNTELVIERFLTQMPHRLSVGKGNPLFNSILVDIDNASGRASSISRLDLTLEEK
ncbi:MAG TPA: TIGR00282 family metallophosphoesterase [Dehalococcoidia bacterium]|nr:TIGR00282 family metallophosphoesterase [Dehalococcoidia bacterium]